MTTNFHLPAIALVLAAVSGPATDAPACSGQQAAASTFVFTSNPWLNLYNFLFKSAKVSRGIEDEGLAARGYVAEDTAAIRPLSDAERRSWTTAVEFFARSILTDRLGIDSLVMNVNDVLTNAKPDEDLARLRLHPEIRRVLEEAMPIYRSAWWPVHDRRNQEWIGAMRVGLLGREGCLIQRSELVFRTPWPVAPRVDATVYASWFGAYSTRPPTRITIAANALGSQGSHGVEVLLHEAGHSMIGPLDSALTVEAARQGKTLPPQLSHFVLFYTAGALMREQDARYVPFADEFGIWGRNDQTRRYRNLIERAWQPYLSGTRSFADAVAGLVKAVQ